MVDNKTLLNSQRLQATAVQYVRQLTARVLPGGFLRVLSWFWLIQVSALLAYYLPTLGYIRILLLGSSTTITYSPQQIMPLSIIYSVYIYRVPVKQYHGTWYHGICIIPSYHV